MKLITNKSKNLLYRIADAGNAIVQFSTSYAVVIQRTADTSTSSALKFKIIGYTKTDYKYITDKLFSSTGKLSITFTTPSITGFTYVLFGVNGSKIDTACRCDMDLKPSTTYTFTCNFTNITQGSISWKDMMLVEGSTAGEYEPYSYNLLDKWKFPATQTVNRVTFTNNGDGTITADGIPPSDTFYVINTFNRISGHRYVVSCNYNRNVFTGLKMETQSGSGQVNFNPDNIFTATSTENTRVYIDVYDNHIGPSVVIPQLYDLTLMYGAGNEPTTVEQFYTDHPELKVSPLGFIGLKNLEISNKNIKRLKYKTSSGNVDLGIIPSNSGYILDKYNNLSEELLEENVEKDTVNYHIPDKTNILLDKVEGKTNKIVQLLDKSKYPATTTSNGVTFTNNGDGSITVNGTASAISGYKLIDYQRTLVVGHKYLISGAPIDASSNAYLQCYDDTNYEWLRDVGSGCIATFPKEVANLSGSNMIRIRINSNYTTNNLVFKPQLFDLTAMYGFGKEPTTVEQFKKDYPQFFDEKLDGIWNVRTSGISTTGKNLFVYDQIAKYDYNKDYKKYNASNAIFFKAGTYSITTKNVNSSVYCQAFFEPNIAITNVFDVISYDSSLSSYIYKAWNGYAVNIQFKQSKVLQFTLSKDCYLTFCADPNAVTQPMIELGTVGTDYEPYQENKIDLLSTQTLNGINEVNDYIEVIDKGNGLYDLKKTQNIDSVDLGTLDWGKSTVFYIPDAYIKSNSDGLCKKFLVLNFNKSVDTEDYIETRSDHYLYFRYQSNSIYKDMTPVQFKTAMNGIILYYQLKTPVTTTIATNLTYNQVSAIRTNGGLLLVNDNNNQKYAQPNVIIKSNYQYKS